MGPGDLQRSLWTGITTLQLENLERIFFQLWDYIHILMKGSRGIQTYLAYSKIPHLRINAQKFYVTTFIVLESNCRLLIINLGLPYTESVLSLTEPPQNRWKFTVKGKKGNNLFIFCRGGGRGALQFCILCFLCWLSQS